MDRYMIERIKSAFSETEYPGDDLILVEKPGQFTRDSVDAANLFLGKRWESVDLHALDQEAITVTGCLSIIGSAYYMPAILIATILCEANTNLLFWHDRYIFGGKKDTKIIRGYLSDEQVSVVHDYVLKIGTILYSDGCVERIANAFWGTGK